MRTYAVVWSDTAEQQLDSIRAYLTAEVSARRAEEVAAGLVAATRTLAIAPRAFPIRDTGRGAVRERRILPKWSYIISYEVDETRSIVAVATVEHTSRNA